MRLQEALKVLMLVVFLSAGAGVVYALHYSEGEMLKRLACDDLHVSFGDRVQFKKRYPGVTFMVVTKGDNSVTLSTVTNIGVEDKQYDCNEVEKTGSR